jgi:hypothetical protein
MFHIDKYISNIILENRKKALYLYCYNNNLSLWLASIKKSYFIILRNGDGNRKGGAYPRIHLTVVIVGFPVYSQTGVL